MYKPKTVFSSNWDLIAPRVIDARAHKVPNIAISLGVIFLFFDLSHIVFWVACFVLL